jgi:hypothetical protein
MFRALFASLAVACVGVDAPLLPDEPLPDGWDEEAARARIEPASFALVFSQDPLVPDSFVTLTVTGAAPNDLVRFAYSTTGTGNGPCLAAVGGLCVDILGPLHLFGNAIADGVGTATLDVFVPANAPQIFLFTQAVIDRGANSVKTQAITAPVLAGALDDDGDGFCDGAVCADPGATPGDCADDEPDAFPGATAFHDRPYPTDGGPSFDYDCDGREAQEITVEYECTRNGGLPSCPHTDGWDFGLVPDCGEIGTLSEGCIDLFPPLCIASFSDSTAVQRCR